MVIGHGIIVVTITTDVMGEVFTPRDKLLMNNGLNFNLANLLRDDLFVVFTEDGEILLNDYNILGMADNLLIVVVSTVVT